MEKLRESLIKIAVILVIIAVIYKFIGIVAVEGGYGEHNAGPLGVAPDAFLQFSGLLLLFSIALNLQRFVSGGAGSGAKGTETPSSESEG
jgi:hypothetical protein